MACRKRGYGQNFSYIHRPNFPMGKMEGEFALHSRWVCDLGKVSHTPGHSGLLSSGARDSFVAEGPNQRLRSCDVTAQARFRSARFEISTM